MSAVLESYVRHRANAANAVRKKRTSEHLDRLILAALKDGPLTINKIARAAGLSNWAAAYHVKLMCRAGVLTQLATIKVGRGESIVVGLPGQHIDNGIAVPRRPSGSGVIAPSPYFKNLRGWGGWGSLR